MSDEDKKKYKMPHGWYKLRKNGNKWMYEQNCLPAMLRFPTRSDSLHLSRLGQKKFYFFLYIFYQTLTDF